MMQSTVLPNTDVNTKSKQKHPTTDWQQHDSHTCPRCPRLRPVYTTHPADMQQAPRPLIRSTGKRNPNVKNQAEYSNRIDTLFHIWQGAPNSNRPSLPQEQAIIRCRKAMSLKQHANPNISTLKKENCQDVLRISPNVCLSYNICTGNGSGSLIIKLY